MQRPHRTTVILTDQSNGSSATCAAQIIANIVYVCVCIFKRFKINKNVKRAKTFNQINKMKCRF